MTEVLIRAVQLVDRHKVLKLKMTLDQESSFMLLSPGERPNNVKIIEDELAGAIQAHDCYLVVESAGQLVGYLHARRGSYLKNRHSAYIVVGLLKSIQGRGIGTQLFGQLDQWAQEHEVRRLELTVMETNEAAKHLYAKMGFVVEGIRRQAIKTTEGYENEVYMAKYY
ncbi:GNAT family N-acetyltransferase [Weissella halotolerans]|uniref:N-acetyltransferase domain-containing protein n=1 Tax=Weissella halotolerans DSM 20190 TaxID=1123500 RepID=A0A0R2FZU5_9LACO|nr:GNAT family N-acetyltransferase [Weissella halotolerans]KRN30780.1 hypothetical protein IV68_GL001207 [Weissella halotolerans DSM 20190]